MPFSHLGQSSNSRHMMARPKLILTLTLSHIKSNRSFSLIIHTPTLSTQRFLVIPTPSYGKHRQPFSQDLLLQTTWKDSATMHCAICLDDLDCDIGLLPCEHIYHHLCIKEWSLRTNSKLHIKEKSVEKRRVPPGRTVSGTAILMLDNSCCTSTVFQRLNLLTRLS